MPYAAIDYARAATPEPCQILGVRLKPLCLHHCILMQGFDLPFIDSKESLASKEDLILAILICSKLWMDGEFEEYVHSDQCVKDVEEWGDKIGKEIFETRGEIDLSERINIFAQYIAENSDEPMYWELNEVSQTSGAHWTQCILLTLSSHLGYTRQQALHAPLKQALSDYFRHAESQGSVQLMSRDDIGLVQASTEVKND